MPSTTDWITPWRISSSQLQRLAVGLDTGVTGRKVRAPAAQKPRLEDSSPLLALNCVSSGSPKQKRSDWRRGACCAAAAHFTPTAIGGPGPRTPPHGALQQGERAQERALRSSREADGHRRRRRFALPVVASGWRTPPRAPRSFQTLPAGFEVLQIQARSQMCCSLINFRLTFYLRLHGVVSLSPAL